jgi:hypothetical protein
MRTNILFLLLFLCSELFAGTKFYRLTYRDDPATTIVVGWCDNGTSTNAKVYYGTVDNGTNHAAYPLQKSIDRTESHRGQTHRFARITGLTPNTVYYFIVKDDQGVSQRMYFRTLSDDPNTPLRFIVGGDTRTGAFIEFEYQQCRPRRQDGNRLVSKLRPNFIAFNGDFVFSEDFTYGANNHWADWWTDWQLTQSTDGQMYPVIPAYGNHEDSDDIYKMFDMPEAANFYAFNVGGKLVRFYSLNSDLECGTTQLNWFTSDLQTHTNTSIQPYWKIIQYHIPLVPHGEYSPATSMTACWTPLFRTYKVAAAFEGHTHIQKVTWPIVPSTGTGSDNGYIKDTTNGTVYVGEGCWGAPLRDLYTYHSADAAFNWTRNQGKFSGFNLVCVSKSNIQIRTIKFENVSATAELPANPGACDLPTGVSVWAPSNGSVVTIYNHNPLGSDANLASLTTSAGTLTPSFSAATTAYTVTLPFGTTAVPTVSATAADANSMVQITQAQNLTGSVAQRTATVLVTADNGTTTKTYTVVFSVTQPQPATLSSLTPSIGSLSPAFSANTFNYIVNLPQGTTTVPTVSATPTDPAATVTITQPTVVAGTAIVQVVSSDGLASNTYTVQFNLTNPSDKNITAFVIAGQIGSSVIDQNAATIAVTMPSGTVVTNLTPTITITGVSVTPASGTAADFTNPVTYTVTAADNSTKAYIATVTISATSNNANLASLSTSEGSLDPVFSPNTLQYNVELPQGTSSVIISATAEDPAATKRIFPPANLNGTAGQRTGTVVVVATDSVTTKVYSILFSVYNSIVEGSGQQVISIFPNPATDNFFIEGIREAGVERIEIINGLGHQVKVFDCADGTKSCFDVSGLSAGTYYIMLHKKNDVLKSRLIVN